MTRTKDLPFYDDLQKIASLILKCREDIVDDIVQETYIEIYEKYEMPLNLLSKDELVDICSKRCRLAYSEMMKSPSRPIRNIKTEVGSLDPDFYFEIAAYRTTVYQQHSFEVNFSEALNIKKTSLESELLALDNKNISFDENINNKESIRFSNKYIFEQVRHLWKKKRTKYLDSLIQNAQTFKINAAEHNEMFREYLKVKMWGDGIPACPECKYVKTSYYNQKRYRCHKCRKDFFVGHKTIFIGAKIPLAVWFYAIWAYVKSDYNKLNSRYASKMSGVGQKTMWHLLKKIYENVTKFSSSGEFSINGIENTFFVSEIDDLLRKISIDIVEVPEMKDYYMGKKIITTDPAGKTKEFESIQIAGRELGIDWRRISECVNGKRINVKGYSFQAA